MPPRASIVIPTHNRADLLPAAIDSLLAQTVTEIEIIVVDDGSTDATPEVVQPFLTDGRVRYVRQANAGRSAARNRGAQLAQAEFLGFLDSDDRQLPGAIAAHLDVLAQQPQLALTIGGYEYIDEAGRVNGQRLPWTESSDLDLPQWVFNCFGVHGAFLLRRSWFERVQGYDTSFHMAEDWDFFLRLAQAGCPTGWTRAVVCQYRQHAGSSIHNITHHRDSSLRALDKVFQQPDLPAEVAALAPQARAWVYVSFARRAYAAGYLEDGRQDVQQALTIDPGLGDERRMLLLESLYGTEHMGQPAAAAGAAAVTAHLPEALRRHPGDIRRARARVHMARFFHAAGQNARGQATTELRAAVRLDGRWLFNRGVLAYCLRQAVRRARQAG